MSGEWRGEVIGYVKSHDVNYPAQHSIEEGREIRVDGYSAEVIGFLGSGGEKEVYDVDIGGERKALNLPNTVKTSEVVAENWQDVIREPEYVDRVGEAGLIVNDQVDRSEVEIDSFSFPTVVMKRYRDHEFEIYDKKNPDERHEFFDSFESYEELFEGSAEDIAVMIQENINLGCDSFNICEFEGVPRLYFSDLTDPSSGEVGERHAEYYIDHAIEAMVNTARISHLDDVELDHISDERLSLEDSLKSLVREKL